jgi:lauroyl/myristoyl acyltransferase
VEVKQVLSALFYERADLVRGLMLVSIFRPVAYLLPQFLIWGLALVLATAFVILMSSGRRLVREFMVIFGVAWAAALRLAIRSHAKRFNEFALQQKMIARLYKPGKLPVHFEVTDEARAIIDGPGGFVLAQTHFERGSAAAAVFVEKTFNARTFYTVAFKLPRWIPLPHLWRNSLQLRQVMRACQAIRPRGLEFVYTGGAFNALVERLRTEHVIVSINIDAHWGRNRSTSLERPFCGALKRTFSTGAAKLARLSNAPLLLAMPVLGPDHREVRMRLFGPFRSDAATAEQQDVEITSAMLDLVEREVGMRPCDYVLEIGAERRWETESQRWTCLPEPAIAVHRAPGMSS